MIASSSSSESIIPEPTDKLGPTISPISSSSSSTSRGTRTVRLTDSVRPSPHSSEELVDKESGGLKPASGKGDDKKMSSRLDDWKLDGNVAAEGDSPLLPSSSIPAITNGLEGHWSSALSLPCVPASPSSSPSALSEACCFWASRAANCRRAREGPVLKGAGGGGRMGIGWLVELDEPLKEKHVSSVPSKEGSVTKEKRNLQQKPGE